MGENIFLRTKCYLLQLNGLWESCGKEKVGPCVKVVSPRASLFMHDIINRTTLVALESPSYYTSVQLKTKTKQTNKQKSMSFSLQILNLFHQPQRV
jgi:hypothetical protein